MDNQLELFASDEIRVGAVNYVASIPASTELKRWWTTFPR